MKPIHFTLLAPKERRHQALFDRDLPFRPRTEQNRVLYQRHTKHRAQTLLV